MSVDVLFTVVGLILVLTSVGLFYAVKSTAKHLLNDLGG